MTEQRKQSLSFPCLGHITGSLYTLYFEYHLIKSGHITTSEMWYCTVMYQMPIYQLQGFIRTPPTDIFCYIFLAERKNTKTCSTSNVSISVPNRRTEIMIYGCQVRRFNLGLVSSESLRRSDPHTTDPRLGFWPHICVVSEQLHYCISPIW